MRAQAEIQFFDPRAEERGVPQYATEGSAGLDLRSCDTCQLLPGDSWSFPLGFGIHIKDPTICAMIMPRSGLAVRGIMPTNVLGLIDSDYQGELIVHLKNHSNAELDKNTLWCGGPAHWQGVTMGRRRGRVAAESSTRQAPGAPPGDQLPDRVVAQRS